MAKKINLEKLKQDMERWPNSWAGSNSDIPMGKEIVRVMLPFLLALVGDQLAYTTIKRHMDNLWLLGGEIIRGIYADPELKDLKGKQLILRFVDEAGGPISRHFTTEEEQKPFDASCRKLYQFLIQRATTNKHA
jgi:hypothetical protein